MRQYAGVATWIPTVGLIDDSDVPDAANFNVVGENLADRTAWLHALAIQAVNGVTGGTYAPSAPIIIGGQGLVCPTGAQWEIDGNVYLDGTGSFTPTVTWDGAASAVFQGGAFAEFDSGSTLLLRSGADLTLFAGSVASFAGTTSFSGGFDVLSGATATIDAGAFLHVIAGGEITLARGDGLRIQDGTNPLFVTPRARVIAQPLLVKNADTFAGWFATAAGTGDYLQDNNSGGHVELALTKLINGAPLDRLLIRLEWAGTSSPVTPASVTLYKTSLVTGAKTTLQTWNINTATTAPGTFLIFPLTTPETIDDSEFDYSVEYTGSNGTGAIAIKWFPPRLSFPTINFLGQF